MSNIYIQEPPTSGKVLLKTSVGDIDIELWSKEAPKACRNFIQLCLEGYYDGTIFHRVVKGFIVQGGDPTGTGTGGESIYGEPFKDEIHSRLRFNRRGLVAMANAGKDDNGSQFFFTLAPTPDLQNKHTIFAKVTGETVYNMIKLEDTMVDQDDRPLYPPKINGTEVLNNPFPDIVPRVTKKKEKDEKQDKKTKVSGVKNFKLLSFGEEAEEDEEETVEVAKKFAGKSKSTHDLLSDPTLISTPAVLQGDIDPDRESSSDQDSDDAKERIDRIKNKLLKQKTKETTKVQNDPDDNEVEEEYEFGKERKEELKKKSEELKREYDMLKKDLLSKRKETVKEKEREKSPPKTDNKDSLKVELDKEMQEFREKQSQLPKKGASREAMTLALLEKFKNKLSSAKEKASEVKKEIKEEDDDDTDETWLAHELHFEDKNPVLAKDASTKDDDWFEISDPRNAITKRRREASKEQMGMKSKKIDILDKPHK
ncbi:spliceosome-associated protein CWC27 homolog [Macrosteles quadrilineatus]|uniref:spliceosome-associated protein CWC27 homolog n=1 Tax=Macrosteles quadrilineatus TaxID=74068 RepID=UPI0023E1472E|nr:spliceosome-associated protein CWC27 homolog [Macrosteles quadrilineatus]